MKTTPQGRLDLQLVLSLATGAGLLLYFGLYWIGAVPPRDQFGFMLGRDFVNTWMGARAALDGRISDLFHLFTYQKNLTAALGPMPPHNWSYPPNLLLFIWPLGFLSYLPALAAWSAAGYAAYLGAVANLNRNRKYLAFAAIAPAIGINLFSGQNGFFTAALLIMVFRFWDERPFLAGVFLGLMLYKPHLVVLFPLALALSGRWRVFISAGMTAAVLIAVTALFFGHDVWGEYFRLVVPVQNAVMRYGTGFETMMPSAFMNARLFHVSYATAWAVQIPFTLLALVITVLAFRKSRDPLLSYALLVTASFVVSPYGFDYDMVVFGWLAAMLWPHFEGRVDRALLLAVWSLPLTMLFFGAWGLPVVAPLMAAFLIRLYQKQRGEDVPAALSI